MALHFEIVPHVLQFTFVAGTSRGSFTEKETWWIKVFDPSKPDVVGWGEASPLKGLSPDYSNDFGNVLNNHLKNIDLSATDLTHPTEILAYVQKRIPSTFPTIRFALETALLDLHYGGQRKIFDNKFWQGKMPIPINGLIWMGDLDFMQKQIAQKLDEGFSTIKMKIGAIQFEQELNLLKEIRSRYSPDEITLRVDANGAFGLADAEKKISQLAALDIHSIEQPVATGQKELMQKLCKNQVLPVALDEELIGIHHLHDKAQLLDDIQPQYIILKPSLLGGISSSQEWIALAEERGMGWWFTSMLESNIGLNAIAQLTAEYQPELPQGLGTGQLYHNNIDSPLTICNGELRYDQSLAWGEMEDV